MSPPAATNQARAPRSTTDRSALLQRFLRELREHADASLVPTNLTHPRHRGLSQRQVARALGLTVGYYTRLEAGQVPWRAPWLEPLTRLFDLTASQRATLYRLTLGWTPPQDGTAEQSAQLEALIDAVPFPAQLVSPLGQIEYCNEHLTGMVPSLKPGSNLTKAILLDPLAPILLRDWRQNWALPALGNLRALAARVPEHYRAEMDALIGDVLASPEVRRLWDEHPDAYLGPLPTLRQMNAEDGLHSLYCLVQHPDGHPYSQLIFSIPADQLETPHTRAALKAARPPGEAR